MTKQFGGPGSGRHAEAGSKEVKPTVTGAQQPKIAQVMSPGKYVGAFQTGAGKHEIQDRTGDTPKVIGRTHNPGDQLGTRAYLVNAHPETGATISTHIGNYTGLNSAMNAIMAHTSLREDPEYVKDVLGGDKFGKIKASEITYLDNRGQPCEPSKAFTVRVEQNGFVAHSFGGPGSGRHPEGGAKEEDKSQSDNASKAQVEAAKDTGWKFGNSDQIKGPTGIETRSNFTDKAGNNIRLVSGPMGHFAQVNGRLAGVGWTPSLKQAVKNAQNIL